MLVNVMWKTYDLWIYEFFKYLVNILVVIIICVLYVFFCVKDEGNTFITSDQKDNINFFNEKCFIH